MIFFITRCIFGFVGVLLVLFVGYLLLTFPWILGTIGIVAIIGLGIGIGEILYDVFVNKR